MSDKAVSEQDLKTVFTAAAWAASSFNEQPWRFVLGRKGDPTWETILKFLMPANQMWAKNAPVLFATFAKKTFSHNKTPNGVAQHDVGAACANLALQATALGLHAHGMAGFDKPGLQAALTVPDDFEPRRLLGAGLSRRSESTARALQKDGRARPPAKTTRGGGVQKLG